MIISHNGNFLQGVIIIEIRAEQLQQIREIASRFKNLYCVECAQALKDYLINQGILGKRIKLYTGSAIKPNNYIYDDSVSREAISENGRHEGIALVINSVEIVFDNHHPDGLPREAWMANLQLHNKIFYGRKFQVTEEEF